MRSLSVSVPARPARHARWAKARTGVTAVVVTAALALSGCTTGGGGGPDKTGSSGGGGTFNIGIGVDLDSVDPAQQTTTTVQNVIDYGLESLIKLTKQGKVSPGLAKSWDTSKDGKTITFHLRDGVKFQDGTPFNAKAVKFNLDRIRDPKVKVPLRSAFEVITNVKVVDDSTVKLSLKYADPLLINNLGITTSSMLSPKSVKADGNSYKNVVKPVGTGPYTFQKFDKGSLVVYKKYKDYWGKKPYYGEVDFHIMPEANSREAGLRSGQLQMIMNPPVSDLKSLASGSDIKVLKAPSDRSVFIAFNNSKPPFNNKKVRKAFNYAVDKKAIIKHVLFGAVDLMDSPLAKSLAGYCSAGAYPFNPKKAKKLLKESGVGKLTVKFGTPTGRYLQDKQAAEAIASNLRDIGVKVKVQTMDWPSYQAKTNLKKGGFDMHILGWAPGALDAPTQFQMFQKSDWPPNGLATSFYTNPKVEKLISSGNQELDETTRNDDYCKAQKIIWNDAPWLFLWSQTLILAYSSKVAGVSYIPNEKFNTIYAHPAG